MYINRLLVFQWVLIVSHWWQICSCIHMKLSLYNIYKIVSSRNKTTSFNLTFHYIDDVLSLNNPKFNDYIDVIYPKERAWWLWFPYSQFPYLNSNIPEAPAYLVYKLCHICWRVCSPTVTYDWFPVIWVNRDGCYMWGRKCSLFQEHQISLPLGSSWFYPFIVYIYTCIYYWMFQR